MRERVLDVETVVRGQNLGDKVLLFSVVFDVAFWYRSKIESRAAWERLERELRSSVTDKEEQLAAMNSKLNSVEVELSDLRATNNQLTQHNADCQRLMAEREAQSARLNAQVKTNFGQFIFL